MSSFKEIINAIIDAEEKNDPRLDSVKSELDFVKTEIANLASELGVSQKQAIDTLAVAGARIAGIKTASFSISMRKTATSVPVQPLDKDILDLIAKDKLTDILIRAKTKSGIATKEDAALVKKVVDAIESHTGHDFGFDDNKLMKLVGERNTKALHQLGNLDMPSIRSGTPTNSNFAKGLRAVSKFFGGADVPHSFGALPGAEKIWLVIKVMSKLVSPMLKIGTALALFGLAYKGYKKLTDSKEDQEPVLTEETEDSKSKEINQTEKKLTDPIEVIYRAVGNRRGKK